MKSSLQTSIQHLLNTYVEEGSERGVQAAAYVDGQLVVDAWAGVADVRTGAKVDAETLFPFFSVTKGITATVIHLLAERGQLDYDAPIARYWPEFAANGKEGITVRHALAHTSGLPYMPEITDPAQACDWEAMCAAMAAMAPATPAGSRQVYHPVTYGWILGEIARRVDGRAFQPFIEAEICRPLGITTMFCGIPPELESKVAFLELVPEVKATVTPPPHDVALCMVPLHKWMNRPDARQACQPGANGLMNARAVARHYAALLPGGVDGVELLPPSRIATAIEEQRPTEGYQEGAAPRGMGYQKGTLETQMGESSTAFGHGGHGGSTGFADPQFKLAVAVVRNRYSEHGVSALVVKEIRRLLETA